MSGYKSRFKKKTIIVNLDKGACIFVNFVWIFTPTHKNHNLPYKLFILILAWIQD